MTATADKTAPHSAQVASEMLDVWMSTYKTMNWSQDQLQSLAGSWVEQTRTMRHDGEKVLEVLVSQAKTNVEEMGRLAEHGMSALHAVPAWDLMTMGDLRRQMNDLAKRVDELNK